MNWFRTCVRAFTALCHGSRHHFRFLAPVLRSPGVTYLKKKLYKESAVTIFNIRTVMSVDPTAKFSSPQATRRKVIFTRIQQILPQIVFYFTITLHTIVHTITLKLTEFKWNMPISDKRKHVQ